LFQIIQKPCRVEVSEVCYAFIRAMMEAVRTSETSAYFSATTWRYILDGCCLHLYTILYLKITEKILCVVHVSLYMLELNV
jgi:hypothetical protein